MMLCGNRFPGAFAEAKPPLDVKGYYKGEFALYCRCTHWGVFRAC